MLMLRMSRCVTPPSGHRARQFDSPSGGRLVEAWNRTSGSDGLLMSPGSRVRAIATRPSTALFAHVRHQTVGASGRRRCSPMRDSTFSRLRSSRGCTPLYEMSIVALAARALIDKKSGAHICTGPHREMSDSFGSDTIPSSGVSPIILQKGRFKCKSSRSGQSRSADAIASGWYGCGINTV